MSKFVNLTGGPITVLDDKGNYIDIPPSDKQVLFKIDIDDEASNIELDGNTIPIYRGHVKLNPLIPRKQSGVYYIVFHSVATQVDRPDVLLARHFITEEGRSIYKLVELHNNLAKIYNKGGDEDE